MFVPKLEVINYLIIYQKQDIYSKNKNCSNKWCKISICSKKNNNKSRKTCKRIRANIRKGGTLTTGFDIASANGLVEFTESTYNFTPAESDLQTVTVTSGTTAQTSCSFANLASGNTGYLLWDYSDTTDPLKAIEYIRDNTGAD